MDGGPSVSASAASPIATIVVRDRSVLPTLVLDPEVGFGDAYADGRIQVQGDLVRLLEALYRSKVAAGTETWYSRVASRCMHVWQENTLRGSRHNIHHHYDLGNDFYKLWLDPQLVYTCAYFPAPTSTLEEAQNAKLDYVCRKLSLQPGETVVEAGCGWGALALHMARQYGAKVKAFNVSREQIVFARERALREGLNHQVQFIEDDYRNVSGKFDVFASVGMLEHVGAEHYHELVDVIHRSIGEDGRGFLHFIGRNQKASFSRWMRKRVFPGAYVPTLAQALEALEPRNLSVFDIENLRLHYANTVEHWLDRFERAQNRVAAMYDERFVRTWRLYLAGSAASFRAGTLQLFQILFAGARAQPRLWTRAPLYGEETRTVEKAKWMHAMS